MKIYEQPGTTVQSKPHTVVYFVNNFMVKFKTPFYLTYCLLVMHVYVILVTKQNYLCSVNIQRIRVSDSNLIPGSRTFYDFWLFIQNVLVNV